MIARRPHRPPRVLSVLREHLRETFWFAPTVSLILVCVLWALADALDTLIVDTLRDERDYKNLRELMAIADDARTIVTTIASAMMTFIGVVFSISLVAVQMAAGNFSPRIVRIFIRSRISKLTFSVFLSTFLLSLLVLTAYESEREVREVTSVPVVQSVLTVLMVVLSLLLFIAYVTQTLQLMKVGPVVDRVTQEAFGALARMPRSAPPAEPPADETARISHQGRSGALRDVEVARLVRVARRHDVVLRLIPRVGDFVVPGTHVLTVHGGAERPLSSAARRALQSAVSVGVERTFRRDLAFGLRQLADIGLRAMSSSVNDPTTAVQCLDRIVQYLAVVAHRPLGTVYHQDGRGRVRLIQQVSGWEDLVDLGFAELRGCAVGNPQVTRRMMAGFEDLLQLVPPERCAPLERHREMLVRAVRQSVSDPAERDFALEPDRQGIG